jgi:hypothetical protein
LTTARQLKSLEQRRWADTRQETVPQGKGARRREDLPPSLQAEGLVVSPLDLDAYNAELEVAGALIHKNIAVK